MMARLLAGLLWLGVLLGVAACRSPRADEGAGTIVVPGDVNHEALHALERARGRHLTRDEILELHRAWIDDEVLYREGLRLPPRPGEAANRERIIARALQALDQKVRPTSASEEELRRWFEGRRGAYEVSALFDFEDAVLPGPSSESATRDLVEQLNRGSPLDPRARRQAFKGRPESTLAQGYGADVARALSHAPPGRWLALPTRSGWRALRLTAFEPGAPASFDAQHAAIRQDFLEAEAARRRDAALRALWAGYRIELEETVECLADKG